MNILEISRFIRENLSQVTHTDTRLDNYLHQKWKVIETQLGYVGDK